MMNIAVGDKPPHTDAEISLELPAGTLQQLVDLHRHHGAIFRLSTRGRPAETYIVAHPDGAQDVLSTHHAKYRPLMLDGNMALVLGRGLLISDGSLWKTQRKLLQRCFHGDALDRIGDRIAACNSDLIERWESLAYENEPIELTRAMHELSIAFNFCTLFGEDAAAVLGEVGHSFIQQLTATTKADTRSNLLFLKEARRVRECLRRLVAARRQAGEKTDDLLSLFVEVRTREGHAIPEHQIVDEIMNILTAGHETVASALKSVWYFISQYPAVAEAIREEAERVIGAARPAVGQIALLRYTRQVIQEAMRLHPPAWVVTHKAEQDTSISGYRVPAGVNVFVCPYLIHRLHDFWPDPAAFNPERFASRRISHQHTHAYLPYSVGPRNCIGDDLSMLEMAAHVASTVRVFDIAHINGAQESNEAGFLLRYQAPVHVRLERRH